jgi:hypothetical protein
MVGVMSQSDFLFVIALLSVIAASQCQSCAHSDRAAEALEHIARTAEKCGETRSTSPRP